MLRTRLKVTPTLSLLLSAAVAILLVCAQNADRFASSFEPHLGQTAPVTLRVPVHSSAGAQGPSTRTIAAGTTLRANDPQHVAAVRFEAERRPPSPRSLLGSFVIHLTLCMMLSAYLSHFGHNRLRLFRAQAGLMCAIVGLMLLGKLILLFTAVPAYVVPAATLPLWLATSFDRRSGFLVGVVLSFVVASLLDFDILFTGVLLSQTLSAALFLRDGRRSRLIVLAGVWCGASSAALLVAIHLSAGASFVAAFGDVGLLACVGGGLIAGVLASLLQSPAERLLGIVPREHLLDLTDLEQPLLKKMAREAPGSWEHARAMANLAEAAASAIGADALLTRVGAYYHDLGKTVQAKYFVENHEPGETSPHDALDPDVSATAIKAHVEMGAAILREGGIPEPVVEFAYTHHGTQLVEYFWNKCQEQGNPKGLDQAHFRYLGMKPQTRETAILMLVDSIEAASRTIDPPERAAFETMIQRIIFTKLASGQIDESGLTVVDLRVLINRMTDTLVNMNHHRIKYPWQKQHAAQFGVPLKAMGNGVPTPRPSLRADAPADPVVVEGPALPDERATGSSRPAPASSAPTSSNDERSLPLPRS